MHSRFLEHGVLNVKKRIVSSFENFGEGHMVRGMNHRLKEIRKTLGLTQAGLAGLMKTDPRNVGYLETNPERLNMGWIENICNALKIHPAELFMRPTFLPNEGEATLLTAYRQADEGTKVAVNRVLAIPFFEAGDVRAIVVTDEEEMELLDGYRKLSRENRVTLNQVMKGFSK